MHHILFWRWKWSCSVMSDSLRPLGLQPPRLFRPWDFPDKSTEVGCHFLLQGIFPTQGLNPSLPHCRWTLYRLSYQESWIFILLSYILGHFRCFQLSVIKNKSTVNTFVYQLSTRLWGCLEWLFLLFLKWSMLDIQYELHVYNIVVHNF